MPQKVYKSAKEQADEIEKDLKVAHNKEEEKEIKDQVFQKVHRDAHDRAWSQIKNAQNKEK